MGAEEKEEKYFFHNPPKWLCVEVNELIGKANVMKE
jgi:hypothetical protein